MYMSHLRFHYRTHNRTYQIDYGRVFECFMDNYLLIIFKIPNVLLLKSNVTFSCKICEKTLQILITILGEFAKFEIRILNSSTLSLCLQQIDSLSAKCLVI
jgi:hypothetical protein